MALVIVAQSKKRKIRELLRLFAIARVVANKKIYLILLICGKKQNPRIEIQGFVNSMCCVFL